MGFNPNGSDMKDKNRYGDRYREFFGYGVLRGAGMVLFWGDKNSPNSRHLLKTQTAGLEKSSGL